jgi:hypothetical protein
MNTKVFVAAAIVLFAAGCATAPPVRRQFDDISLPAGMVYQPGDSIVIESPTIKAAQLVYRGRLEPLTLGDAMRMRLEASGWRQISRTSTSADGTRQVYEKDGAALDVHIYEGLWYTYLALSTSQVLPPAPVQTGSDTPPAALATGVEEPKAQSTPRASANLEPGMVPENQTAAPAKSDPSFTQRVKDFFTNLFTW